MLKNGDEPTSSKVSLLKKEDSYSELFGKQSAVEDFIKVKLKGKSKVY